MLSDDLSDKMSDPTQGRNSRRIPPECGNAGEFHAESVPLSLLHKT